MKILYIGTPQNHELYQKGENPSHWMYGAEEMLKDGHEVIFEREEPNKWHDGRLMRKYHPDMVFIPNLNLHIHWLFLVLTAFHFYSIPVYGVVHHAPRAKGIKKLIYRLFFAGVSYVFTLSDKTRQLMIDGKYVISQHIIRLDWGPDMAFYEKYRERNRNDGFFISTGKECRDFDIIIEAFRISGAPLKIMTAKSHGGYNYEYLQEKCKDIPNIEVVIQENTGAVYPGMCEEMSHALALVCPLKQKDITYNVGLSTVLDAEGLGKQLIITKNPYHSEERIAKFHSVETIDDWLNAIKEVQTKKEKSICPMYTMSHCYEQMKQYLPKANLYKS